MKNIILLFTTILLFQSCNGQNEKQFYSKDFQWRINIPENFKTVSAAEWLKMQNKGAEAIEKTYDGKVENKASTIFVFKNDQLHYFEANYQPFDTLVDGNYIQSFRNVNEVLYETFKAQMPGAKIDTLSTETIIGNLTFQVFKTKITLPNQIILNLEMYSRLFDKREFTVNIMFVDEKKGKLMLDAWKNSQFN